MFPCPGGCSFQPREEEQQQQEQQEGSMSHFRNSGIKNLVENHKTLSKTIVFLGFQKGR